MSTKLRHGIGANVRLYLQRSQLAAVPLYRVGPSPSQLPSRELQKERAPLPDDHQGMQSTTRKSLEGVRLPSE